MFRIMSSYQTLATSVAIATRSRKGTEDYKTNNAGLQSGHT